MADNLNIYRFITSRKIAFILLCLAAVTLIFLFISGDKALEKKPLYWVSQMDPNYRSSAPGQCPHGMDLVPVYAEDVATSDTSPGVVRISPEVQHQMGVRTAKVTLGSLKQTLRAYGRVVPDKTRIAKISPRINGWVDILFVHAPGETVQRGQPLFSLFSPELVNTQEVFLRTIKNGDSSAIAKAESQLRALQMDDFSIAQLKTAGVPQRSVIFRSPKDGTVDMIEISEGDYVRPRQMMLAIGSMEKVWIELEIFESQASQIKAGQALTFTTPSQPGLVWEGEVDSLYPDLEAKTRALRFRAEIDNTRMLLRPNMQVEAFIALPQRPPALLIPRAAVIDLGEHDRAIIDLGEGRFKSVRIIRGESNSELVEVLEGLQEGDVVVTSAHFLIDSESSKTSDFLRMEAVEKPQPKYPPAWVAATIMEIHQQERKLRLQHEAVADWQMPGMTMNFKAADDVDLRMLKIGQRIEVLITDGNPLFQVLQIKPAKAGDFP